MICPTVVRPKMAKLTTSSQFIPGEKVCLDKYSKTCLERPLKNDNTKVLMTNDSLMKVESIEECSP